jgi:hypothetical protein
MVAAGMAERRRSGGRSSSAGSEGSREADDVPTKGTAPSAANIEDLEKFEPSEKAKRHTPSDVDAMGQDKRREAVGHSYGPSARRQIMFFVAVAAALVIVVGGWLTLVSVFDKAPTHFKDSAPWSTRPASASLAAEQAAPPVDPTDPCGEPGNPYPVPAQSPCAPPAKANAFQGNSSDR